MLKSIMNSLQKKKDEKAYKEQIRQRTYVMAVKELAENDIELTGRNIFDKMDELRARI